MYTPLSMCGPSKVSLGSYGNEQTDPITKT